LALQVRIFGLVECPPACDRHQQSGGNGRSVYKRTPSDAKKHRLPPWKFYAVYQAAPSDRRAAVAPQR